MRRKPEIKYCIEGPASFDGLWENIRQYICAYNEPQAFKRLALKLERERGQSVYLGDCEIYTIKVLPPDKPARKLVHEKIKEKQLSLNFYKAP